MEIKYDLISRQGAIESAMNDSLIINAMDSVKDGDIHRTKRAIVRLLASLPPAQPFNKGLWVKQELAPQTLRFCSLCGCKKPRGVAGNFCPNCGASMDGERR